MIRMGTGCWQKSSCHFPLISTYWSPYVWVGKTGASGHCNAHRGGVYTTGISGGVIKLDKEMDIPCTHYDKYDNKEKNGDLCSHL